MKLQIQAGDTVSYTIEVAVPSDAPPVVITNVIEVTDDLGSFAETDEDEEVTKMIRILFANGQNF